MGYVTQCIRTSGYTVQEIRIKYLSVYETPVTLHRSAVTNCYYPHMPIGKLWIYRLLFVCFLYGYGFLRPR